MKNQKFIFRVSLLATRDENSSKFRLCFVCRASSIGQSVFGGDANHSSSWFKCLKCEVA